VERDAESTQNLNRAGGRRKRQDKLGRDKVWSEAFVPLEMTRHKSNRTLIKHKRLPEHICSLLLKNIDGKNRLCFLFKFKIMFFYVFFYFLNVFLCFSKCCVFVVVKTKTYKITNMMHFSCAKTLFPGQSECFVAVLLTLFDSY